MKQNGFTLIEMLVVVVIIATLAGITFKLVGAGGASSDKAVARQKLEQLANAIEEYRAEYGKYPPVSRIPDKSPNLHQPDYNDSWTEQERRSKTYQPIRYEYPGSKEYWTGGGQSGSKNLANFLKDVPRDEATVFVFGLMSYLECRVEGRASNAYRSLFEKSSAGVEKSHWLSENSRRIRSDATSSDWNVAADNPRDIRAARKIAPFIENIRRSEIQSRGYNNETWTNSYSTVWDPWSHEICYESDPPYDSYRIWSIGPDGKSGTADDIFAGREN